MMGLAAEDIIDLRRWAVCAAVIVLAHGGIRRRDGDLARFRRARRRPPSAIVIEFAPVPLPDRPCWRRASARPRAGDVGRLAQRSDRELSRKRSRKRSSRRSRRSSSRRSKRRSRRNRSRSRRRTSSPRPIRKWRSSRRAPQEVKQETPQQQVPRPPAPATTAPQAIPEEIAPTAVAPEMAPIKRENSPALMTWRKQISAMLERNKRYPETSQSKPRAGRCPGLLQSRPAGAADRQPRRAFVGRGCARRGSAGAAAARAAVSAAAAGGVHGRRAPGSDRADPLQSQVTFCLT